MLFVLLDTTSAVDPSGVIATATGFDHTCNAFWKVAVPVVSFTDTGITHPLPDELTSSVMRPPYGPIAAVYGAHVAWVGHVVTDWALVMDGLLDDAPVITFTLPLVEVTSAVVPSGVTATAWGSVSWLDEV